MGAGKVNVKYKSSEDSCITTYRIKLVVESKAFCLSFPPLTDYLEPPKPYCNVACQSVFYQYFHAICPSDLTNYAFTLHVASLHSP